MIGFMLMKQIKISRGGQISVPAEIRHRWSTSRLVLEDEGDRVVIRPLPDDPVSALRGALKDDVVRTSDEMRAQARADERAAEARRSTRP
jgi:bifunctional DNA-binding transcriptional regulator/antitoxin component of YhaV-PrlF toxin-antitoxin module